MVVWTKWSLLVVATVAAIAVTTAQVDHLDTAKVDTPGTIKTTAATTKIPTTTTRRPSPPSPPANIPFTGPSPLAATTYIPDADPPRIPLAADYNPDAAPVDGADQGAVLSPDRRPPVDYSDTPSEVEPEDSVPQFEDPPDPQSDTPTRQPDEAAAAAVEAAGESGYDEDAYAEASDLIPAGESGHDEDAYAEASDRIPAGESGYDEAAAVAVDQVGDDSALDGNSDTTKTTTTTTATPTTTTSTSTATTTKIPKTPANITKPSTAKLPKLGRFECYDNKLHPGKKGVPKKCKDSEHCCQTIVKKVSNDGVHAYEELRSCAESSECEGTASTVRDLDSETYYCKEQLCNNMSKLPEDSDGPKECYTEAMQVETCIGKDQCCKRTIGKPDKGTGRTQHAYFGCSIFGCDKAEDDQGDGVKVLTCKESLCGWDEGEPTKGPKPKHCITADGFEDCGNKDEFCGFFERKSSENKTVERHPYGCTQKKSLLFYKVPGKHWMHDICEKDYCNKALKPAASRTTTAKPTVASNVTEESVVTVPSNTTAVAGTDESIVVIVASAVYVVLVAGVEGFLFWHLRRHFKVEEMAGPTEDNRELGQMQRKQEEAFGESNGADYHVPGRKRPASANPGQNKAAEDKPPEEAAANGNEGEAQPAEGQPMETGAEEGGEAAGEEQQQPQPEGEQAMATACE